MGVYVDEPLEYDQEPDGYVGRKRERVRWCHMIADTEDELHAMAQRIGLRREWAQEPKVSSGVWHYDLVPTKRDRAIKLGAVALDSRAFIEKRREIQAANAALPLKVRVYPFREKIAYGNIRWVGKHEARRGVFPADHPCAPKTPMFGEPDMRGQGGVSPALDAFRERGYWASCFPEGDGITWKPERGQGDEQCIADIRECFGWIAEWAPGALKIGAPA